MGEAREGWSEDVAEAEERDLFDLVFDEEVAKEEFEFEDDFFDFFFFFGSAPVGARGLGLGD